MLSVVFADEGQASPHDRGLSYGDGLFETIRMVGTRAVLRKMHVDRLVSDAAKLGIPIDSEELWRVIDLAAQRYSGSFPANDWVLKLTLTRGAGGRGYRPPETAAPQLYVSSFPMPPRPDDAGVTVRKASFPLVVNPRLAGIKSLNRLDQVMASREFSGKEWELIMADTAGHMIEGTRTNLLALINGEWLTPPASHLAVAGVMRQYCLSCLRTAGKTVKEQLLDAEFWLSPNFQALYLLNSVFGAVRVSRFESADLPVEGTLATICDPLKTLE